MQEQSLTRKFLTSAARGSGITTGVAAASFVAATLVYLSETPEIGTFGEPQVIHYDSDPEIQRVCPTFEDINTTDRLIVDTPKLPESSFALIGHIEKTRGVHDFRDLLLDGRPDDIYRMTVNSPGGLIRYGNHFIDDVRHSLAPVVLSARDYVASAAFDIAISADFRTGESDTRYISHGSRHSSLIFSFPYVANYYTEGSEERNRLVDFNVNAQKLLVESSTNGLTMDCAELLVSNDNVNISMTCENMLEAGLVEFCYQRDSKTIIYDTNKDTIPNWFNGGDIQKRIPAEITQRVPSHP